jgi:hypothetical protein
VESSVALGLAVLFMEHFAAQAGQTAQLMSVRRYFNTHLAPLPASDDDFASLLISVDFNESHAP